MTLRDVAGCLVSGEALANRFGDILSVISKGVSRKPVVTNSPEPWQLRYALQDRIFCSCYDLCANRDAPERK